MSLQYIIDGYNVIRHPEFPVSLSRKSAPYLTLLKQIKLRRLCGSPKNRVVVVLDGYPPVDQDCPNNAIAEIIFSGQESADERIKRLVERSSQPCNIAVVSDDKEIRLFVQARGAKVLGVEEFISPPRSPARRKEEITKPELSSEEVSLINQELRNLWLK
jgi:predicted RNA-binding protein with PIN domain